MSDFVIAAALIFAGGILIGLSIGWKAGRRYEERQRTAAKRRPSYFLN